MPTCDDGLESGLTEEEAIDQALTDLIEETKSGQQREVEKYQSTSSGPEGTSL